MQFSPSFDNNWGKQNKPVTFSYPPDCVGGVTEPPNCCAPFESLSTGRHPFENSPHTLYLDRSVGEKLSNVLAIFMDLLLKPITNIWSALSR